jgi:hypothetical protein
MEGDAANRRPACRLASPYDNPSIAIYAGFHQRRLIFFSLDLIR